MDKHTTELLIKLDYIKSEDIDKFISLIKLTNLEVNKIGIDEFSVIIKE